MAFDTALVKKVFADLESRAATLGLFDKITGHEPKNPPGTGLSVAFWGGPVTPAGRASGLAATSLRFEVLARVFTGADAEPLDGIDPAVFGAAGALLAAYSGAFTLSGDVMAIDLLGAYGAPMAAVPGYLGYGDRFYRVMNVTVPVIADGVLGQAP